LIPILAKGLAKDPELRYARGSQLAADLRACAAAIKSGVSTAELTQPLPPAAPASAPEDPGATIRLEAPLPASAPAPIAAEPVLILPEPTSELVRDIALPPGTAPASEGTIRLPPRGAEPPASDDTLRLPPDQEKP
jgi:hypothetical protein